MKGGSVTIEHSDTRPFWAERGCDGCKDTSPQMIIIRVRHGRSLEDDKVTWVCRKCSSQSPRWAAFDNSETNRLAHEAKEARRKARPPTLRDLLSEAFDHLEYCGWGDSWERECSGDLRDRMATRLGRE
jgi:hypothetical protein